MGSRKKTILALLLTVVAMISLVSATFAWMTMSASPTVTDLALYLVSDNNSAFLLAPDENGTPGEYGLFIDLHDRVSEDDAVLKPISFSAKTLTFDVPQYGFDGRVNSVTPVKLIASSGNALDSSSVQYSSPAADAEELAGCVYVTNFWMKAESTPCTVNLVSSFTSDYGAEVDGTYVIGEPTWNTTKFYHEDSGAGAEYAVRLGFLFFGTESDPDDYRFVVYEPNADGGNATATDGRYLTYSLDGSLLGSGNSAVKVIQQGTSVWKDTDPILKDTVLYESAKFISEDTSLLKLGAGEERRVTLFIWLEGQDSDCTNKISAGSIIANIQFSARNDGDMPLRPD